MIDVAATFAEAVTVLTLIGLAAGCAWLAVRDSPLAPLLVAVTVPVQRVIELEVGPWALTATQLALAGFLSASFLNFASGRLRVRMDAVSAIGSAVVLVYLATVLVADDLGAWAGESYRWASAVLFFVLARWYLAGMPRWWIAVTMGTLALLAFGWAVSQVLRETGPASFNRNGMVRAFGGFGEPNPFGAFAVAVSLPLVAATLFGSTLDRRVRIASGLAALSGVATIGLTQSRGALLGLVTGVGILGFFWVWTRVPGLAPFILPAGCALAAVVVALVAIEQPWDRIDREVTTANWAELERTTHWAAAVSMVEDGSILGVGGGGFSTHFRDATTNWRFRISRGHAHNAYLQVASEGGALALLAYAAFLGAIVATLWRRIRSDSCDWLGWGVLAVTAALMAHQMFDYLHVLSLGLLYSGLWAAALPAVRTRTHNFEHRNRA